MNVIDELEREQIEACKHTVPEFAPGDTVLVQVWVREGGRELEQRQRRLLDEFIAEHRAAAERAGNDHDETQNRGKPS